MCWSASVSLNTFIFSMFSVWFAYFNNITKLSYVFAMGSFASMQLLEYFVWTNTFSNELISKIALCILMLVPVIAIFCLTSLHYISILLGMYSLFIMFTFVFFKPWNTIDFRMIPSKKSKHLSWLWLDFPWYITILWFIFLIFPSYLNGFWVWAFLLSCSAGYSYVMFSHDKTWGSIWCWICNATAIYYIYKVFMKDIC
jgi:hypothetical protein